MADLNDDQARAFHRDDVSICLRTRWEQLVVRGRNDGASIGGSREARAEAEAEAEKEQEEESERKVVEEGERRETGVTAGRVVQEESIERCESPVRDLEVSAGLINPGAVWRK